MGRPRFFLLLRRAHGAIRRRTERETRQAVGLTALELTALFALARTPGLGVQGLADALHINHAAVSRLSQQLLRKAVVQWTPDPNDRRRKRFTLTEAGQQKARDGEALLSRANAALMQGFSDEELAVVARFLRHLIDFGNQTTPL